jgi:hypothetical protein
VVGWPVAGTGLPSSSATSSLFCCFAVCDRSWKLVLRLDVSGVLGCGLGARAIVVQFEVCLDGTRCWISSKVNIAAEIGNACLICGNVGGAGESTG